MPRTEIQVRGLKELGEGLKRFSAKIEREVLEESSAAAGEVILRRAKSLAPRGDGDHVNSAGSAIGHMADSLVLTRKKPRKGQAQSIISSATHASLIHLVEFGTAPHVQPGPHGKGAFEHPGATPKPFLRPALDEGFSEAVGAFAKTMDEGVKREASAVASKAALRVAKRHWNAEAKRRRREGDS